MLKDIDFYHLQENMKNKYWIKDQMPPEKAVHKAGEFIGNKIADALTKSNHSLQKYMVKKLKASNY